MLSVVCRLIANHPSSSSSKAHQKSGSFPPPALPGLSSTTTLSDSRPNRRPNRAVEAAALVQDGSPPITRNTLPACRAHYPGGSRRVLLSVASPPHAAFPVIQAGRHPRLHFRGLLRLHSRYGPQDCSTALGGLCHEASARPVTRQSRSSATRSNRLLSGWLLPPLVFRAVGAHRMIRARGGNRNARECLVPQWLLSRYRDPEA